jgi:hypothetical protein
MCHLVRKAQHNASPSHRYVSSVSESSRVENYEDDFSSLTTSEPRSRTMHYGMEGSSGSQTTIDDEEFRQREVSLRFQHTPAPRTHLLFI